MTWRRQTFSLTALRADAARFALLCAMLLALPLLHPVAEARAAKNGLAEIICTKFGIAPASGTGIPIGAADDSPCAVLCNATMSAASKILTPSADVLLVPKPRAIGRLSPDAGTSLPAFHARRHAIRGPPHSN